MTPSRISRPPRLPAAARRPAATTPRRSQGPFAALLRPGRARTVAVRRLLAVGLVIAALCNAAVSLRAQPEVAVFAADVVPGQILSASDITVARLPADSIPASALESVPEGSVVVAAAGAGEVVTSTRLLGPELTTSFGFSQGVDGDPGPIVSDSTEENFGTTWHMVPLPLAEPDVITLLHHGDEVSIITAADSARTGGGDPGSDAGPSSERDSGDDVTAESAGELVAAGGRVISTALPQGESRAGRPGTILVGLPAAEAQKVAALSLTRPLTVVLTGPRAAHTTP